MLDHYPLEIFYWMYSCILWVIGGKLNEYEYIKWIYTDKCRKERKEGRERTGEQMLQAENPGWKNQNS